MRKCKICGIKFKPQYNSVQLVCSAKCGYEYAKKQKAKDWKKRKKEKKESLKTRTDHLNELQKIFNKWIRLSKKPACISCGTDLRGRKFDAGHYRSVGNQPSLRFEPDNVWPQCVYCNQHLSANLIEYRIRLIKEIGAEGVEWLEKEHEPKNYTIPELIELKVIYKDKIKGLNK